MPSSFTPGATSTSCGSPPPLVHRRAGDRAGPGGRPRAGAVGDQRRWPRPGISSRSARTSAPAGPGSSAALERVAEHARLAGDRRRETEVEYLRRPRRVLGADTGLGRGCPRAGRSPKARAAHKWGKAWSTRAVIGFYGMQGRFEEARDLVVEARAALEELGRPLELHTLAFWTGPLELLAGDPYRRRAPAGAACEGVRGRRREGLALDDGRDARRSALRACTGSTRPRPPCAAAGRR